MYDKYPYISVSTNAADCHAGWMAIGDALRASIGDASRIVCVECYPGVHVEEVREQLIPLLTPSNVISIEDLFLTPVELTQKVAPFLTDDPVFGVMNAMEVRDFFDSEKLLNACQEVENYRDRLTLVIGTGAFIVASQYDLLIYADLARWEIQQRQRRGEIGNLAAQNEHDSPAQKYKRAFFLDWRVADRLKQQVLGSIDFVLDTNVPMHPKLISGDAMRMGLNIAVRRPFRVVPFFDPGPWGGHWMEKVFDLPRDVPNYAWCFDCVPEENSLLLGFGEARVEIPSINLVLGCPRELLGNSIYEHFGAEFPIRFDLLDTIDGGNLSLQVHLLTSYVPERFSLTYTQDER
jgi:hypothetical protein